MSYVIIIITCAIGQKNIFGLCFGKLILVPLCHLKMVTGRQIDTSCRLFEPVGMHLIDGNLILDISGDKSIALYTSHSIFFMHFACMLIVLTAYMVFPAFQTAYITLSLTLAFTFVDMDGNSV